jgi:hypothetical protein
MIAANKEAARLRKGDSLRTTPHCRASLHLMTEANFYFDGTHGRRRCIACRRASSAKAPLMSAEVAERVKQALQRGASLSQVAHGRPVGGGKRNRNLYITSFKIIKRYRRENPDFDRFVTMAIADSPSVAQRMRHLRKQNEAKREEINDYYTIRAMLPANFPGKDDVVSDIFEDLLNGTLKRENVKTRAQTYIAAYNRLYPTKYAKFGDSQLVSLDEVLFEGGYRRATGTKPRPALGPGSKRVSRRRWQHK